MSILDDIYDGRYSVEHPAGGVSKEVLEQDTTFWEKVKGLLGGKKRWSSSRRGPATSAMRRSRTPSGRGSAWGRC